MKTCMDELSLSIHLGGIEAGLNFWPPQQPGVYADAGGGGTTPSSMPDKMDAPKPIQPAPISDNKTWNAAIMLLA